MHSVADPGPQRLRPRYQLDQLTDVPGDTARLLALTGWVHDRMPRTQTAHPVSSGPLAILSLAETHSSFRDEQHAIVLAAAAQSVDVPARTVTLIARDGKTRAATEVGWKNTPGGHLPTNRPVTSSGAGNSRCPPPKSPMRWLPGFA